MKKKEKRMIGIIILIGIIIIAILMIISNIKKQKNNNETASEENVVTEEFVDVLDDGTKLNTSDKLHETKEFDGMQISNFQLTENNNVTLLLGTITNVSDSTKGGYPVNITILDKEGNEIVTVGGYIQELSAGESAQLNTSATFDYANAYDFTITKK